jgi:MFS family permease
MLEMQKRLSNTFFALISLPATAMGFALSIQISALSWLLSTKYGLHIDEIGIVWAAGPTAGILGQVLIGLISDKAWFWGGRRRPFVLIGGTLAALSVFLLPRIDEVARLLPGIGGMAHALGMSELVVVAVMVALTLDLSINISFNPTRAIIADVTPEGALRTKGYTWMQTISGFWGVMAYLIGALFDNYALISVGVVIVLLFSVVPMFFVHEERVLETPEQAQGGASTDWSQLWRIYVAHGFAWLGVQSMFVYIIAFINQHVVAAGAAPELSGQAISISFAIMNTVGFLLPALVLQPLTQRIGRVRTQVLCMGTMAAAYFAIAFGARSPAMLYVLMAVVGIGWSAVVSLPFAIMSEVVDRSRMGFFMGMFNLSVVLPQLLSTGVGKILRAAPDSSLLFIICGSCLLVSALLWAMVRERAVTPLAAPVSAGAH